ncbi:MAG: fibronectin type III domain-containing protein [Clostridia bacterium]|nr:fibronectin type III domain-containing protein [Clostridia bacterium]
MKTRIIAILLSVTMLVTSFAVSLNVTSAAVFHKQAAYSVRAVKKVKSVTLAQTKFVYSGKQCTPAVMAEDSTGNLLIEGVDYELYYSAGRTAPGKYAVKVVFQGDYKGSATRYFTIRPRTASGLRIAVASPNAMKLVWKAQTEASGYTVQYYNVKYKRWMFYRNVQTNMIVAKNLNSFTTYHFRVCAYTKSFGQVYYGAFAAVKGMTTPPAVRAVSLTSITKNANVSPPIWYHYVKWTKASGNVAGYQLQFGMPDGWYTGVSQDWFLTKAVKGSGKTSLMFLGSGYGDDVVMARVRTYCIKGGKYYFGPWSNVAYDQYLEAKLISEGHDPGWH